VQVGSAGLEYGVGCVFLSYLPRKVECREEGSDYFKLTVTFGVKSFLGTGGKKDCGNRQENGE
jgi:hypothetical protein